MFFPLLLLLLPLLVQRRVLQPGHNMTISVEHSCLARMCDFAVRLLNNLNKQSLQLHAMQAETIRQSISWSLDQCNPNQRWNYFNLLRVCSFFPIAGYWIFGAEFCDTWVAFDVMCSTASILNLCAISMDRYIHIKDPLR